MATQRKPATPASKPARAEAKSEASKSKHNGTIAPVKGKLGIMIPGMGAVATTFVAGVEAVRKGISPSPSDR